MSVGLPLSKAELDHKFGSICKTVESIFTDVASAADFCDSTPDADLIALGFTSDEVATIKTAINDLRHLRTIYFGDEALAAPKDFRAFTRRLWGSGTF